jgi:hypothetical protein
VIGLWPPGTLRSGGTQQNADAGNDRKRCTISGQNADAPARREISTRGAAPLGEPDAHERTEMQAIVEAQRLIGADQESHSVSARFESADRVPLDRPDREQAIAAAAGT